MTPQNGCFKHKHGVETQKDLSFSRFSIKLFQEIKVVFFFSANFVFDSSLSRK